MQCILLVDLHYLKLGKPLWVIFNHSIPIIVHKMELRQLSSSLITCAFENHLQNAFQECIFWNGKQTKAHTDTTLVGTSFGEYEVVAKTKNEAKICTSTILMGVLARCQ